MFRLPTHLESFIPPPRDQVPTSRPWTGSLRLPSSSSVFCTAAETEGENHVELWPTYLDVQVIRQTPLLPTVQGWLRQNSSPMCMFMPGRIVDGDGHKNNLASFEAFATMLADNQLVAVASWNVPDRLTGGGIIIFPTRASRALLVGAVFLNDPFPSFMAGLVPPPSRPSITIPRSLLLPQSPSQHHAIPNIASSQRHSASQSPSSGRGGRFSG